MFQAVDATLIRAAAYPQGLTFPAWPDLTSYRPSSWVEWLRNVWALPEFAEAVGLASPDLSAQITRVLDGDTVDARRLRRLTEATVRYVLRWRTRATPFGRFAGVASGRLGTHAAFCWDEKHHAVPHPREHHGTADGFPALRTASVVTSSLGYVRGGAWVTPCVRVEGGRLWDAEVDLTGPAAIAVEAARSPIPFVDLAELVAKEPDGDLAAAEVLLAGLVNAGILLTDTRRRMITTDADKARARSEDFAGTPVDLRLDCSVTLPPSVVGEVQDAASALVAVAPRFAWAADYHRSFIERWGPGAAVPAREVLRVLGYPAGYRTSTRRRSQVPHTRRDSVLFVLAQEAALDDGAEVLLDDETIAALRGEDDRVPIPHTELRFTLAADTVQDLDRGKFTLTVVSAARHAGVSAARFLHLLDPADLDRFRRVYEQLLTASPGAYAVQVAAPPLNLRIAALACAPELLPVLPVSEFHPDPAVQVDDLAVAGDGLRLWLVSRTTGRPVEPLLFNSVLLPTGQHPLVRFLVEIWTAFLAPCARFDWGHAIRLPFLPRVRRGRSILHPARWLVPATAFPGRRATWREWKTGWDRYRERYRLPREVFLGEDDERVRLDLDENAHLALLRSHLDRYPNAVLTETPGASGWSDGRPAEILLTLARTRPPTVSRARPCRPASVLQHRPGRSPWLDARLFGRSDDILTHLTSHPRLPPGWWFLRYPDPEPHLRLRIPLHTVSFADAAYDLATWTERLHDEGLLTDYLLTTYRPEARHGTGPTLAAAETVFAADSRNALRHLSGDRQAATAAGMLAIAHGFTGDGPEWLVGHAPRLSGPRLDPAQLTRSRRPFGDADLSTALGAYRTLVEADGLDVDQVLSDLLHLHHARMIGVDVASERHCLRLARAVALTHLARTAS
ncbi:thiopeptide-type bacteriocin biosynthesis domain-containing protein [Sinosporangium album]|uniref:Thiopeptide-type bacteriocin biosynthesis domain-containing protein n=1 Tax=Sinosporangium album TaxID=504805 RepID=A0A1G7R3I9_9ACTN|nr:lantibiotic dehydratase [Sinosporangium album]SDG05297.1 thiopeptide-type bacteriocin biosynthesis domain-containing protein [Sinosporangium album]